MRKAIVYLDGESGHWIAEVPSLPGCVTDGDTREAALENARDAVRQWMDAAATLGRQIPPEVPLDVVEVNQ